MRPIASFIVPAYNEEKYIRKCIDSLLAQTEPNFEIVVVDDGSTDGTFEILTSYQDPRIRVHRQENRGRVGARNKALELSQGKYVILQDADDWSAADRLEKQLHLAEKASRNPVVGTGLIFHYEGKRKIKAETFPVSNDQIRRIMGRLIFRQAFFPPTMLALREKIIDIGGWRSKFKVAAEDGDLLSRLYEEKDLVFLNTPDPLYDYRHNEGSITNSLDRSIPQQMFMKYCERARRRGEIEPEAFEEYLDHMMKSVGSRLRYKVEYKLRCIRAYMRWERL